MLVLLLQVRLPSGAHQCCSVSQQLRRVKMSNTCTSRTTERQHPLDPVQCLPLPPRYGDTTAENRQHTQRWKKPSSV